MCNFLLDYLHIARLSFFNYGIIVQNGEPFRKNIISLRIIIFNAKIRYWKCKDSICLTF